jgi:4-amino-4-deoxy-L-arabinose transferase-like glycosyltransferase
LAFWFGSLWGDEVWLAINLVNRSYGELLAPLDHNQAAPPAFLWIEKLAIQVFGNTEYALRLFPLICGIISILAFYKLATWALSGIAVPIALLLFTCLRYPIYYATEVKQYSTDMMIALLLSLLLIPLQGQLLKKSRALLVGFMGGITVWFSYPAIFVLVGLEAANLITTAPEKRKAILVNRLPVYWLWVLSFAGFYFLVTREVMQNQTLQSAWGGEYPASVLDILWLLDSFGRFFARPLGFPGITDGIALVAFLVGCFGFYRRDKTKLLILMAPTYTNIPSGDG